MNSIEVQLSDPIVKSYFLKYAVYAIIGEDKYGSFQISRRYREFTLLRYIWSIVNFRQKI
jgi:hypothetical protein